MEEVRARGLHRRCNPGRGRAHQVPRLARYMTKSCLPWRFPRKLWTAWPAAQGHPKGRGDESVVEIIQQMQKIEGVAGVHIMAIEWEEAVREMVDWAGLMPRPAVA